MILNHRNIKTITTNNNSVILDIFKIHLLVYIGRYSQLLNVPVQFHKENAYDLGQVQRDHGAVNVNNKR